MTSEHSLLKHFKKELIKDIFGALVIIFIMFVLGHAVTTTGKIMSYAIYAFPIGLITFALSKPPHGHFMKGFLSLSRKMAVAWFLSVLYGTIEFFPGIMLEIPLVLILITAILTSLFIYSVYAEWTVKYIEESTVKWTEYKTHIVILSCLWLLLLIFSMFM